MWIDFHIILGAVGIPPEHLEKIFNAFDQVDSRRSQEAKGTGLGLALVNKMVEGMGGSVNVSSKVDVGSRFEVSIPEMPRPESLASEIPQQKPKALIVDDDSDLRDILESYLDDLIDYEIHSARDGLEAIDLAQRTSFHLFIIDFQMPKMNGIQLLDQLKKQELVPADSQVFICTGAAETLDRSIKSLVNIEVIEKPFSFDEIKFYLKKHIQNAS